MNAMFENKCNICQKDLGDNFAYLDGKCLCIKCFNQRMERIDGSIKVPRKSFLENLKSRWMKGK